MKIAKKALLLTGSSAVSYGLSFVRNLILARALAKADFGLAAAFSMTVAMLELAGRMGFGKQIIQSEKGDTAHFQAVAHMFQFGAGLASSILVLAMCVPLADWFKAPHAVVAFGLMALVPLFRGLEHLDNQRVQRELHFLPSIICDMVPQLTVTLAAWPLAIWLKDYRAVLWIMIGKSCLTIFLTHVLAKQRYRWAWDRQLMMTMFIFSWPLVLNGIAMYLSKQGDQALVAAYLSMSDLAVYSVCFSLAGIPWFISSQVAYSIMLPMLSRLKDEPLRYQIHYRKCLEYITIASCLVMMPLIVVGEQSITLLYGQKYAGSGAVMAILAATSAIRFQRITPAIAAMAKADTVNQLYSNLSRMLSIPIALAVIFSGGRLASVAVGALIAELAAGFVSMLCLRKRQKIPLKDNFRSVIFLITLLSMSGAVLLLGAQHWIIWKAMAALFCLWLVAIAASRIFFPAASREILSSCMELTKLRIWKLVH